MYSRTRKMIFALLCLFYPTNLQAGFLESLDKALWEFDGAIKKALDVPSEAPEPGQLSPSPSEPKLKAKPKLSPQPTSKNAGKTRQMVTEVQASLNSLGYDAGSVDGAFGSRTQKAIREFQTDTGVLVNGRISQVLIKQLQLARDSAGVLFAPTEASKPSGANATRPTKSKQPRPTRKLPVQIASSAEMGPIDASIKVIGPTVEFPILGLFLAPTDDSLGFAIVGKTRPRAGSIDDLFKSGDIVNEISFRRAKNKALICKSWQCVRANLANAIGTVSITFAPILADENDMGAQWRMLRHFRSVRLPVASISNPFGGSYQWNGRGKHQKSPGPGFSHVVFSSDLFDVFSQSALENCTKNSFNFIVNLKSNVVVDHRPHGTFAKWGKFESTIQSKILKNCGNDINAKVAVTAYYRKKALRTQYYQTAFVLDAVHTGMLAIYCKLSLEKQEAHDVANANQWLRAPGPRFTQDTCNNHPEAKKVALIKSIHMDKSNAGPPALTRALKLSSTRSNDLFTPDKVSEQIEFLYSWAARLRILHAGDGEALSALQKYDRENLGMDPDNMDSLVSGYIYVLVHGFNNCSRPIHRRKVTKTVTTQHVRGVVRQLPLGLPDSQTYVTLYQAPKRFYDLLGAKSESEDRGMSRTSIYLSERMIRLGGCKGAHFRRLEENIVLYIQGQILSPKEHGPKNRHRDQ